MIGTLMTLLLFQLAGEVLVHFLGLPLPGPVLGMVLLFVALLVRGAVPARLGRVTRGLLGHLSLLFVPAGVGIIVHLDLVRQEWLPIVITLIVSTAATIVVTAFTLRVLIRRWGT